jgi:DNA polymerase-3 subunit epsilon
MFEEVKQWWYRQKVDEGPMATYLAGDLPALRADARTTEYLALDLETTGLDVGTDAVVSVGFVPVVDGRVQCHGARHQYVQFDGSVAQSATIHHIRDSDLREARPVVDVLSDVLDALAGRVLLVHHAPVDLGFLSAACRRSYGVPLVARVVDTLDLARRRRERGDEQIREGELRLHALRSAYGLPRYAAHDALTDALATAELFLAMLPAWAGDEAIPLRTLVR